MKDQLSMFEQTTHDGGKPSITPVLNPTVHPDAKPRLGKQQQEILDRLQRGPATNVELAAIGIRYSARIHELRTAGYVIEKTTENHATGLVVYRLVR